jgi:pyruvate dehydrogenase E2 component (dihydrolipoamide acetyltransferase)
MTAFKLPDLGEGLKEADLVEWLVKEGQSVKQDQLILLVETAKAIVELPAPSDGVITRLAFVAGDTVKVGAVLFEYEEKTRNKEAKITDKKTIIPEQRQSVSVVGDLIEGQEESANLYEVQVVDELHSTSNSAREEDSKVEDIVNIATKRHFEVTPKMIAFAKKMGLNEVLDHTYTGELTLHGLLAFSEQKKAKQQKQLTQIESLSTLKGARKEMANQMTKAHQEIPCVTLFEDADISSWSIKADITFKLIQAIIIACSKVPIMNAWYDSEKKVLQQHKHIDLGLAVNSERGLFVPVLKKINSKNQIQIRIAINNACMQIKKQSIQASDLEGATISLSNFGVLSGRYATPSIVPPQVCILGAGKIRNEALVKNNKIQIGKILPLSLSFDHRIATGAEAALFLQNIIQSLEAE